MALILANLFFFSVSVGGAGVKFLAPHPPDRGCAAHPI